MSGIVRDAVFNCELFSSPAHSGKSSVARAAQGFAAIFGRMMARTMISASSDSKDGFLGMGNGAAGDIYSSFLEQELGKVLAGSRAMKPLVDASARQLEWRRSYTPPNQTIAGPRTETASREAAYRWEGGSAGVGNGRDALGPLILPLPAAAYGSLEALPPPTDED